MNRMFYLIRHQHVDENTALAKKPVILATPCIQSRATNEIDPGNLASNICSLV